MTSSGRNILNLIYLIAIVLIILLNLSPTTCYDGPQSNNVGRDKIKSNEYLSALSEAILSEPQNKLMIEIDKKRRKLLENELNFNEQNYITNKEVELMKLALQLQSLNEKNSNDQKFKYETNIPNDDVVIYDENKLDYSDEFNEHDNNNELESNQIYGIQNVKRNSGGSNFHAHITYQSLCPSIKKKITLETTDYIYRPNFYHEVTCASNKHLTDENKPVRSGDKVCNEAGFNCIQLNRTIYLTKKRRGYECWETDSITVPAGCECMWPKHKLGDISIYSQ